LKNLLNASIDNHNNYMSQIKQQLTVIIANDTRYSVLNLNLTHPSISQVLMNMFARKLMFKVPRKCPSAYCVYVGSVEAVTIDHMQVRQLHISLWTGRTLYRGQHGRLYNGQWTDRHNGQWEGWQLLWSKASVSKRVGIALRNCCCLPIHYVYAMLQFNG